MPVQDGPGMADRPRAYSCHTGDTRAAGRRIAWLVSAIDARGAHRVEHGTDGNYTISGGYGSLRLAVLFGGGRRPLVRDDLGNRLEPLLSRLVLVAQLLVV